MDAKGLFSLGQWDIVYSWGVSHHTGNMWQAMENVSFLVKDNGRLFISIYNDQGRRSRWWRRIKKAYVNGSIIRKWILLVLCLPILWGLAFIRATFTRMDPFYYWNAYKTKRGMSAWHDVVDWVGGYPFEVAKPEEVFSFFKSKTYSLFSMITRGGGHGCNQFVFLKDIRPNQDKMPSRPESDNLM